MTSIIKPLGAVDHNSSITEETKENVAHFYSSLSISDENISIFIETLADILAQTRATKLLKDMNSKPQVQSSIDLIAKSLSTLIPALKTIDNSALQYLQAEINKESEYLGFKYIEQFKRPHEYADNVLVPFQEIVISIQRDIKDSGSLKKQTWKHDFCDGLVRLHHKITEKLPENIGSGGNAPTPPFYNLVKDIGKLELNENIGEESIRDAIKNENKEEEKP